MADEKPTEEQTGPLTDDQAKVLAGRLDDDANPLNTKELSLLDDYYLAQENKVEAGEPDPNASLAGEEPKPKPGEGDKPAAGGDALQAAIDAKNNANQYAGQQSHQLGQTRKDLEVANQELAKIRGQKPPAKPKEDGAGGEVDMNDPEQFAKATDDRIQAALNVQKTAQDKVTAEATQSDQNYQRGKANLESLQTGFKGVFDTSEPITEVMDKVAKGQHVSPEDSKIAEKVTFLNQWGRDRNIFDLTVANREFNHQAGIKDPLRQKAEERGRNDLVNAINENETQHPNLTDVPNAEGKKVMTIADLERNPDHSKVLDNMTVDEVKALEDQINSDESMSMTG